MKNFFLALLLLCISSVAHSQRSIDKKDIAKFEALVKKGDSLVQAGKTKESIAVYTEALKIRQNDHGVLYSRGTSYFAEKEYINSISDFTRLIEFGYGKANEAYFIRGLGKTMLNDPKVDGCADLKEAKKLDYKFDWEMFRHLCTEME